MTDWPPAWPLARRDAFPFHLPRGASRPPAGRNAFPFAFPRLPWPAYLSFFVSFSVFLVLAIFCTFLLVSALHPLRSAPPNSPSSFPPLFFSFSVFFFLSPSEPTRFHTACLLFTGAIISIGLRSSSLWLQLVCFSGGHLRRPDLFVFLINL